ncbi:MAG: hypothetical protein ACREBU_08890 [Nitrososphaera sp.]
MSGLIITALSEDLLAAPKNRKPNYIVLSVTDSDGVPISGLESPDFTVKTIVAPGGGTVTQLVRSAETEFPGVYLIEVVPEKKSSWKKGVYIFAVGVHRKFDRGQSLASVFLD